MFSFLRQTFCQWARTGTSAGAQRPAVGRLQCEALEDRMLLSASGAQLFAGSLSADSHAAVATSPGGRSVVAWQESIGALHDIHAQIFDAAGHKVGGDILVAGNRENQYDPTVAINANGDFIVAWTMDFSPTDTDVHATLFRPDGSRVAGDFDVAATPKREYDPSAGIDARGDFVISYTLQFNGSDTDVKAALFSGSANLLRRLDVAVTPRVENNSHVVMDADGNFTVSYLVDGAAAVKNFAASGEGLGGGEVNAQGHGGSGSHTPPPHHRPPHHTPPPPHHTPPPHQTSTLHGVLGGGYAVGAVGDAGTRYDLVGIGDLTGVGEVTVSGDLRSTGFLRSSHADGRLTLAGAHGTVTLDLVGPAQGAFAALPEHFHFTVERGTGAYSHLHATGTLNVQLFRANHTLSLDIEPAA